MPNIEIHGFAEKSSETRRAIWAAFFEVAEDMEFVDSVTITAFPSETENRIGAIAPFIRVFFACKREMEICRRVLAIVPNRFRVFFDVEFIETVDRCSMKPRGME